MKIKNNKKKTQLKKKEFRLLFIPNLYVNWVIVYICLKIITPNHKS